MCKSLADPLLIAARGVILVLLFLSALAALAFAIYIPLAAIWPDFALALLIRRDIGPLPGGALPLLLGLAATALLMMLGAVYFLKQLLGIVGSVVASDPFVPANADRLARMGWTVLAVQVVPPAVLGLLELRLQRILALDEPILVLPFMDNGLVMAFVLFVLARVFRHGAAMREELEGTV